MRAAWAAVLLFLAPGALVQRASAAADTKSPFIPVPALAPDSLRFNAPLPEFEARDINGRIWRTSDLRGKFTLVYIWSTFAARVMDNLRLHANPIPGISDLPDVQRLYDELKDSSRIQLLTFCADYDYTHAPEYMRQTAYTFPVIADWVLLRERFPGRWPYRYLGIDPEGRISDPFHYLESWAGFVRS